jgi:predicted DNA-binding transcriptional regulator YafY
MNRIDRLFGIVTLLQSRNFVSAEKISEKFGISVRTVYRDIKAIGEQGVPLSFEPGKGYFIVKGFFLPPVSFTQDEAAAFLLMENVVNAFTDKSVRTNYSSGLNKVKSVMTYLQKEKLEVLSNSIRSQHPARLNNNFEFITDIQNSITSKQQLEIDYKNQKQEISKRCVEPIGLVFYAFAWHLIAWCELRKEYRDFRVERISKLKLLEKPFAKAKHIQIGEYMKVLPVDY